MFIRFWKNNEGSSFVEAAILMPIIIRMLLAGVDMTRVLDLQEQAILFAEADVNLLSVGHVSMQERQGFVQNTLISFLRTEKIVTAYHVQKIRVNRTGVAQTIEEVSSNQSDLECYIDVPDTKLAPAVIEGEIGPHNLTYILVRHCVASAEGYFLSPFFQDVEAVQQFVVQIKEPTIS